MNVDQDLFSAYAFYAGVVTLKMLVMSFLTARQRFANGVFISSEDIKGHEKEYKVGKTFNKLCISLINFAPSGWTRYQREC